MIHPGRRRQLQKQISTRKWLDFIKMSLLIFATFLQAVLHFYDSNNNNNSVSVASAGEQWTECGPTTG